MCSLIMVEPLQVLRKAWNPSGFCYPLILSYSEWINNSRIYFLELSKYLGQKLFFTDSNHKIALLKYIKPYYVPDTICLLVSTSICMDGRTLFQDTQQFSLLTKILIKRNNSFLLIQLTHTIFDNWFINEIIL